jgi:Tfp pilus assembly protein FimT
MAKKIKAFSMVELIIIVAIVAALTFIAVPRLGFTTLRSKQADTVAKKIITDLRRTRRLAISDAANNTDGFALNMTGGGPYTGYEIEDLSTSTIITNGTFSIDSAIRCTGEANFQFGPLGNLKAESDAQLLVEAGDKTFTITVIEATGTVKCTETEE